MRAMRRSSKSIILSFSKSAVSCRREGWIAVSQFFSEDSFLVSKFQNCYEQHYGRFDNLHSCITL